MSDTSLLPFSSTLLENHLKVGDSGTIQCKSVSDGATLKTWNVETLNIRKNPVLQLNKISETKIKCESEMFSSNEMKLQAVYCQGQTECKLNEFCFEEDNHPNCVKVLNGEPCRNSTAGESLAGETTASSGGALCLNLPQNGSSSSMLSQGMLRCSAGNYSYQSNYFRGFDNKLYLNWEKAPLEALIQIFVPNVTMYPQNSYPFGCKAVTFIGDGKLQWVIRGKDGSEILLHKNRVQDIYGYYLGEEDYQLYTVRESNIRLIYPNDYDIICMAPRWNATAFVRNHIRINVAGKMD